jgi:hypothetical protein
MGLNDFPEMDCGAKGILENEIFNNKKMKRECFVSTRCDLITQYKN